MKATGIVRRIDYYVIIRSSQKSPIKYGCFAHIGHFREQFWDLNGVKKYLRYRKVIRNSR